MAERRMFSKAIIDSDAFLDMPLSTQALYFHLSMRADDDGFVGNPRKIMQMIGASNDDARVLLSKRFILEFESGVIVIKHWRINNYIQRDRYKSTTYVDEFKTLTTDEKNAYTELKKGIETECIQNGYKLDTQNSINKNSIEKNSIDKVSKEEELDLGVSKVSLQEVRDYIWKNNLKNLKPLHYYNRINVENIENWKEFLVKENELCNN